MKVSEVRRKIEKAGCYIIRHGSRHDVYLNPLTGEQFSVSRHMSEELAKGTCEGILKSGGVK